MASVDWKLLRNAGFICLPTAAAIALAVLVYRTYAPKMAEDERRRVFAETERAAEDLRDGVASADFVWERGKGIVSGDATYAEEFPADMTWKEWNEWNPYGGTRRKKEMWGWREREGGVRLVWSRGAGAAASTVRAATFVIEAHDYPFVMRIAGGAILAVLVAATAFGVRYFVGYVKARDDFMAATAHDLTTPLVAMRHTIGVCDDEAKRLNERLMRLVANIKDFLRLGGRRPAPEAKPFDLAEAFGEAYALFRDDYRDVFDGRDVALDLPPGGGTVAVGDETLAVQILWNLLGNDLKYAAPYGDVRARIERRGGRIALELADSGPGMSAKDMKRAFDRYWRAKSVMVTGKGGFGIGLCTAREFAKSMGGSLTVRANSPKGCVFALELPAGKEDVA